MKIEFFRPKNTELSKYIEGYYFISPNEDSGNLNYYTFPNNFVIVSVNYGGRAEISENRITVKKDNGSRITADLVSRYIKPIEVMYDGEVLEVTIYFKPLGIHFFDENYGALVGENHEKYFPHPDFQGFFRYLLLLNDRTQQISELEKYLLSKLKTKDIPYISDILNDFENGLTVSESAHKNRISRQYLNRHFLKYIGKTPSEYRKIQRFRKAISDWERKRSLTELSYETEFYDQSHFIKNFKEFTGILPTSFFKSYDISKDNVWLFI